MWEVIDTSKTWDFIKKKRQRVIPHEMQTLAVRDPVSQEKFVIN